MSAGARKIFAVACEHSGDQILSRVVNNANVQVVGAICSTNSPIASRVQPFFDGPSDLGVMGFGFDLVKRIPLAAYRLRQTADEIQRLKPDVLLTVDSGGFNLRLHSRVRDVGLRKVHICAPSVWAFRDGWKRAEHIIKLDGLFHLLPFEPAYWRGTPNADALRFVGYFGLETLLDALQIPEIASDGDVDVRGAWSSGGSISSMLPHEIDFPRAQWELPRIAAVDKARAKERVLRTYFPTKEMDPATRTVLLAPGSRLSVVKPILQVMFDVVRKLTTRPGSEKIAMIVLSPTNQDIARLNLECIAGLQSIAHVSLVPETDKAHALAAADVALAVSGTIVTELLSFRVPSVVLYNAEGFLTRWYAERKAQVRYATLCNIMAGREILPEFLFERSNDTKAITAALSNIIDDPRRGQLQLDGAWPYLSSMLVWKDGIPLRPSALAARYLKDV
jgi:lipid-A-disaccharide synthase